MLFKEKQERKNKKYSEMVGKAFANPENFDEFAENLHLGLGDVRDIKFDNKLLEPKWNNTEKIPELIVEMLNDENYLHFLVKYILNIDLLPFQLVILKTLWTKAFPMLIMTRGGGKTFMLSIYAIVRMLLHQGCKFAIVGASLRQSMIIFDNICKILENAPILQDICGYKMPKRDLHLATWELGQSRAVFLPLGNGEKIRGMRANYILCDEFACLDRNTIVETDKGLVRIEDSFNTKPENLNLIDENGKTINPSKYIKTPLTDVYKITTKYGFSFKCSSIHQVKTTKGFKLAKDLTSEDYLFSPNYYQFPNIQVDFVDKDIAWLMGILTAEGSINSKHSLSVQMTDKKCIDKIFNILSAITKNKISIDYKKSYIDDRGWRRKEKWTVRVCDLNLRNKFVELGLTRATAHCKKIPWSILKSPKDIVVSYLAGLFEGDGSCFHWQDKGISNHLGITYYSVSETLCDDIQLLLRKLNIFGSKVSRKSKISDNLQWSIRLNGQNAKMFGDLVQIPKWAATLESSFVHDNEFKGINKVKGRYRIACYSEGENKIIGWKDTLEEAIEFRNRYYSTHIPSLQVSKVEKLEEKDYLYDYYIPDNHTFNAGNFIQHNSVNKEVFETVVRGFAAVKSEGTFYNVVQAAKNKVLKRNTENKTTDFTIKIPNILPTNQIVIAGTAQYEFNHFYQYYRYYKAIITTGGDKGILKKDFPDIFVPDDITPQDYAILRVPYDVIPEGMMDANILSQGRATMDPAIFDMEYGCIFRSDSQGFYPASVLKTCTCPVKDENGVDIIFPARMLGDIVKHYVMGIDPASEADNFTINILEINPSYRAVVYQFAINRKGYEELKRNGFVSDDIQDYNTFCVTHIRDLIRRFNIRYICLDEGGGGISIRELLKDPDKLLDETDQLILDMDDEFSRGLKGKHILKMINFGNTAWRVEAHHGLKKDLQNKNLLFPFYDPAVIEEINVTSNKIGKGFDRLDDCFIEIEQCKQETTLIKHTQTSTGREAWDVPKIVGLDAEEIKRTLKKDRFTSLLLSNWAARLYEDELKFSGASFVGGIAQKMIKEDPVGTPFVGKGAAKMRYLDDNFINGLSTEGQNYSGRKIFY